MQGTFELHIKLKNDKNNDTNYLKDSDIQTSLTEETMLKDYYRTTDFPIIKENLTN
jgi:hypothetical protein